MIQSALLVLLGFMCAAMLALLFAPALWRRAVALTQRRVEATMPLTRDEVQAEKDSLRAEFAMSARRLEMTVKSLRETTAVQAGDISQLREEQKRLSGELQQRAKIISGMEEELEEQSSELEARAEQLKKATTQIAAARAGNAELQARYDELEHEHNTALAISDRRKIELVAVETHVERLTNDVESLRGSRREAEGAARQVASDEKMTRETLADEQKRLQKAEERIETLVARVSDREEKLDRREKEVARLRAAAKENRQIINETKERLKKNEAAIRASEAGLAGKVTPADDGNADAAAAPSAGADRFGKHLERLEDENARLRAELEQLDHDAERQISGGDAQLRDDIGKLAAEVVHMVSVLEGEGSPIREALAADQSGTTSSMSLADRVRALQEAAVSGK